jgi:hypothetical protein
MATTKQRTAEIASSYRSSDGGFFGDSYEFSSTVQGTLVDFNDVYFKDNYWEGTYNPADAGGTNQHPTLVRGSQQLLSQKGDYALGLAQRTAELNESANPFFGEFFNYYLGIAQERQKTLSKTLTRKELLTGGDAASVIGGTLL